MTLDLIGASSYVWHWKHAIYHHNYVNIVGYDPDMDLGRYARFTPHQKRRWFHRWQHLYMWALYAFLVTEIPSVQRFLAYRDPAGSTPIQYPGRRAGTSLYSWGERCPFLSLAFMFPTVLPSGTGRPLLLRGNRPHHGHTASVVFQFPHCTGLSDFPLPDNVSRDE